MSGKVLLIGTGAQTKYAMETFHRLGRPVAGVVSWWDDPEAPEFVQWRGWCARYGLPLFPHAGGFADGRAHGASAFLVCTSNRERKAAWFETAQAEGLEPAAAIHPAAVIAESASVGRGAFVNAGAVIQPFASVGDCTMIHANASVEHDAVVEDFATVGPGARLAGWVVVERGAVVYTGASVIPTRRIGRMATVGAGAVVLEDVAPESVVAGVPARPIEPSDA